MKKYSLLAAALIALAPSYAIAQEENFIIDTYKSANIEIQIEKGDSPGHLEYTVIYPEDEKIYVKIKGDDKETKWMPIAEEYEGDCNSQALYLQYDEIFRGKEYVSGELLMFPGYNEIEFSLDEENILMVSKVKNWLTEIYRERCINVLIEGQVEFDWTPLLEILDNANDFLDEDADIDNLLIVTDDDLLGAFSGNTRNIILSTKNLEAGIERNIITTTHESGHAIIYELVRSNLELKKKMGQSYLKALYNSLKDDTAYLPGEEHKLMEIELRHEKPSKTSLLHIKDQIKNGEIPKSYMHSYVIPHLTAYYLGLGTPTNMLTPFMMLDDITIDEEYIEDLTNIKQSSLMSACTESTYLDDTEKAGHPWESLHEFGASIWDIAINYPHEFTTYMKDLDDEDNELIKTTLILIYESTLTMLEEGKSHPFQDHIIKYMYDLNNLECQGDICLTRE